MSHLEPIGPIVALAECESESECQFESELCMWVLVHVIVILNQDVNLNFTWTETSQGHLDSRSCHQKKEKLSTWKESRNKQGKNMEITKIPQQDTGPGPLSLAPGRAPCSLPGRKATSECESEQQHKNTTHHIQPCAQERKTSTAASES